MRTYLIDSEIWVRRDDSSSTKVHTFSAQIASKSALFALESLTKSPSELFRLHVQRHSAQLTVDVESALQLQKVPVLDDHLYTSVLRFVLQNCVIEENDLG